MSAIWKRPDGTVIETEKQFITELNTLLARAEKAEAALESAQKMADHWEAKATEHQQQFEECRTLLGERIESLRETLDEWITIAKKAEAERDELKRRAENAELELKRQKELVNPVDWERVRIDAAIAAMQSLMPDLRELSYSIKWVVQRADALVAELQKKEVQG